MPPPGLPASATSSATVLIGFMAYLCASTVAVMLVGDEVSQYLGVLGIVVATTLAMALVDLASLRGMGKTTGLTFSGKNYSFSRTVTKFLGLLASLGFVGLLYWLFPEYHGKYYAPYFFLLKIALPPLLLCALPYLYYVDGHMAQPKDGYWHMGRIVLLKWDAVDWPAVHQNISAWLVKGFFLPLMLVFMCNDLAWLVNVDFSRLTGFVSYYDVLFRGIFYLDVGFAVIGYVASFRLTNSHVRSTEPSMLGWVVALICYPPFWPSVVSPFYLKYEGGLKWDSWLNTAGPIMEIWGVVILLLCLIYVWATLSFGLKFSNLTHRGIITSGPYRWLKHPAYVSKNLSWWLISVPFVIQDSPSDALRHCLLLGLLNGVYWLRAKTEEKHLMADPVYQAYSNWIGQHGLYAICLKVVAGHKRKLT